jgi:uncharacterized protein YbaP (TraB family)
MNPVTSRRGRIAAASILACALALPAVHAWTPDAKADPKPAPAATAKAAPLPLLWKVSDKDNAIYLLGSIHVLKPDDYPLSGDVEKAFEAADRFVFEVPPAELSNPAIAQKMQVLAGYSDGRTLSQVLGPETHAKFARILGEQGAAQMEAFEPWFINLALVMGVSQQMGFSPEHGLDLHIAGRAAAAGKPVAGLETLEDQLGLLDSTPMAEQVAGLTEFVENPAETPRMLTEMHEAWRDGDVGKLSSIALDEFRKDSPETYRLVNVQRNDAWVPKLRDMLDASKDQDTLVVVGAMHLIGKDGVVEKLRAAGYTVERICSGCRGKK